MKHTRKTGRGLSLLLTLAMILTLLPTAALAADTEPTNLTLYFGDPNNSGSWGLFTHSSLTTPYEGGAHSGGYTIEGSTLCLIDFSLSTSAPQALVMFDGSSLEVNGTNSITSTYSGDVPMISALNSKGALTINGSGTLTLQSGTTTQSYSMGLHAENNLTIEEATVQATGGSAPKDRGVFVGANLSLSNDACLTGRSDPSTSLGIGVEVIGGITLNNSELTAQGSSQAVKPVSAINQLNPDSVILSLSASTSYDGSGATSDGVRWVTNGEFTYKVGDDTAKYLNATTPTPTPSVADYTLFFSGGKLYKGSVAEANLYTENAGKWAGSGTTLTLKEGFAFSTTASTALVLPGNTTLNLEGASSVTTTFSGEAEAVMAVKVQGSLTITGTGSLNVLSGTNTREGGWSVGLRIEGTNSSLSIQSATLNATGGPAPESVGIYAARGLVLQSGAMVTAVSDPESANGFGIHCGEGNGRIVSAPAWGGTLIAKGSKFAVRTLQVNDLYGELTAATEYNGGGITSTSPSVASGDGYYYHINNVAAKYIRVGPSTAPITLYFGQNGSGEWNLYTRSNHSEVYGADTDTWGVSGNTLTLNNFNFSTQAATALVVEAVANVVLQGSNSITSTSSTGTYSVAIEAADTLTISGDGSLTATGGSVPSHDPTNGDANGSYGMRGDQGRLVLVGNEATGNGPTVTAIGGPATATGENTPPQFSGGVDSFTGVVLRYGSTLTATGDKNASDSVGIFMMPDSGTITLTGSGNTLTAKGKAAAVDYLNGSIVLGQGNTLAFSGDYDGAGASGTGYTYNADLNSYITTESESDLANAVYAKYIHVAGEPTQPADYTLYYNKANGKLYKDQEYTTAVTGLTGAAGDTSTLTLTNFNFSTSAAKALELPAGVTLTLQGTNTITSTYSGASASPVAAIVANGALTINGGGTLTAQAGANSSEQFPGQTASVGLYSTAAPGEGENDVNINGGATVIVKGGTVSEGARSAGIDIRSHLTIGNTSRFTAESKSDATIGMGAKCGGIEVLSGGKLVTKGTTYALGLTIEDYIIIGNATFYLSTQYDGTGCVPGNPLTSTDTVGTTLTVYKASGELAQYLQVGGEAPAATPNYTLYYNATDGKLHENSVNGTVATGLTGTMGSGNTLTLTDFNFTTSAKTALVMPANSGLTLAGTNSITSTYEGAHDGAIAAIHGEGVLNISGGGKLTVQSGKNTSEANTAMSVGLMTDGNLTITTVIVTATSGSAFTDQGVRVGSGASLRLQNNAKLTASSSTTSTEGNGVYANAITFDRGELVAKGSKQAVNIVQAIEPAGTVITAGTLQDGTNATGTGVQWEGGKYVVGSDTAKYLKAVHGATPTPTTVDYTLYYKATDGKLYKDQAYTTEATGLTGAAGATSTLTLTNFNFSTTAKTALVMPAGSTLALVGDNTITSTYDGATPEPVAAVSCDGELTINGTGKLTIQSGKNTSTEGLMAGLMTAFGLTIDSATVVAKSKGALCMGIGVTGGNLLLKNGAKVTAASDITGMGYGAMVMGTITVNGELILQGAGQAVAAGAYIAPASVTITAGTQFDGTGATGTGVTPFEDPASDHTYQVNGEIAKYLKATTGGSTPTKGTITVGTQPANQTVTYGDISGALTAAGTASNGKAVSYQWYEAKGADKGDPTSIPGATKASYTIPTGLYAGSYYYFCKLTADDCDPVESDVATVTVDKATYTGLKTGSAFVKAEQETTGKTYTLPVPPLGASYGTVTTGGALISGTPTVTTSDGHKVLTYDTGSKSADVSDTITVAVTGALNYNNYNFVLTVTASGKTEAAVKGLTAAAGLVYDGAARQGYTGTPAFDPEVTADPSILVYSYVNVDGTSYGPSATAPTNAGNYKLTVSFPAENENYVGSVDLNFTIARKPVTLSLEDKTITAGDPVPTSFSAKFTGVVEGETLTLGDHTPSVTGRPANSDTPGDYTITWANMNEATPVAGADTLLTNYVITTLGSCTLTINAKSTGSGGGGGGGGGSSTVTVPATGLDGANVKASVSGGKATISSIDTSKLDEDSGVVSIDLTGLKKDVDQAGLPTKTVDEIAQSGADGLELRLSNGTVEFDNKALRSIADQADGNQINLVVDPDVPARKTLNPAQQETVDKLGKTRLVEVYLTSNNQRISNFDGGVATIRIPLPSDWDPDETAVVFVDDQGNAEIMETRIEMIDGKPFMVFETTHFSHYLITTDADTLPGQWVNPFTDVEEDDWFYGAVKFMNQQGLMSGTSDTTFSPGTATTRGMIVTILYRMEGEPSITEEGTAFTDVSDGQYYSQAVAWGSANGIVKGYDDGRFGPDDLITREQLAAILYRYAQYKGQNPAASGDLSGFGDQPSAWALDAVKWAVGEGIVTGKGEGILDPLGKATRAEAATMLQRFLEAK